jgi:hypothetical protein
MKRIFINEYSNENVNLRAKFDTKVKLRLKPIAHYHYDTWNGKYYTYRYHYLMPDGLTKLTVRMSVPRYSEDFEDGTTFFYIEGLSVGKIPTESEILGDSSFQ